MGNLFFHYTVDSPVWQEGFFSSQKFSPVLKIPRLGFFFVQVLTAEGIFAIIQH